MEKRVIFIGGCPRSGTTMLGSMLGSTLNCITTPESYFKQKILIDLAVDWSKGASRGKILDALSNNFRFKIWGIPVTDIDLSPVLTKHDYRDLMFRLVDDHSMVAGKSGWNVWIDHTPVNFQNALMLLDIFPNAKFIHIIRDPRAVAASIIPLDWGPNTARDAAEFWARKISYALAFESLYPEKCFRVKYEDIVCYPEKTLQEVCDFTDIKFEQSMLLGKGFKVPDYSKTQHALIGKPLDLNRIEAWKKDLSELQIYQIEKFLEDLPEMMGYSKTGLRPVTANIARRTIFKINKKIISYIKKKRFSEKKKVYGK